MTNMVWQQESNHARNKIMSCFNISGFWIGAATKSDPNKWRPVSIRSKIRWLLQSLYHICNTINRSLTHTLLAYHNLQYNVHSTFELQSNTMIVKGETHCYYMVCCLLPAQWALSESSHLSLLPSKLFVKGGEIDEGTRPENERKLNYCSYWEKKKTFLFTVGCGGHFYATGLDSWINVALWLPIYLECLLFYLVCVLDLDNLRSIKCPSEFFYPT